MKEYPILFTAPMVRALIDGRKTQTRRIVKELDPSLGACTTQTDGKPLNSCCWSFGGPVIYSPYGRPGCRLWVRETFFAYGRWETRYSEKKKRDEWHFIDMTYECGRAYQYAADNPDVPLAKGRGATPGWWKRPAIFMPRHACRILLDIDAVRVERLRDCSQADARSEGIEPNWIGDLAKGPNGSGGQGWVPDCGWRHYTNGIDGEQAYTPIESYRSLWESINGHDSWAANPWVWVVSFRTSGWKVSQ